MKKLALFIAICLWSFAVFAQLAPVKTKRIANATTQFSETVPVGTEIYNIATEELFVATSAISSTSTLTTASSYLKLVGKNHWQKIGDDIFYNSGKVGIGTSTPSHALTVVGGKTAYFDIDEYSDGFVIHSGPDGEDIFRINNDDKYILLNESGRYNVGIGTFWPETELDVAGFIGSNNIPVLTYDTNNDLILLGDLDGAGAGVSIHANNGEAIHISQDLDVTVNSLAGTGERMVTADANGILSTQDIPAPPSLLWNRITTGTPYLTPKTATDNLIIKGDLTISDATIVIDRSDGEDPFIAFLGNGSSGEVFSIGIDELSGDGDFIFSGNDNLTNVKMKILASSGALVIENLSGVGERMVTASANGILSTQDIPEAGEVSYIPVTLNSTQVSSLGTAQTLLPAPGVGKAYYLISCLLELDVTTQLDAGIQQLYISGDNTGTALYGITNANIESNSDKIVIASIIGNGRILKNTALTARLSSLADPESGDVTMTFHLVYRVINISF